DKFNKYKRRGMRLGTGEFTDSLALDHITGFSIEIVNFFRKHLDTIFEFKTKSATIENIIKLKPSSNIVVSWSISPQRIIDENEYYSASLTERINAAVRCIRAGYRVGFHFDPVIYYPYWQDDYTELVEILFDKVKPCHIAWVSIGTLRFSPELKPIIEKRFPKNKILDEELLLGFDNKLHYVYPVRYNIYRFMIDILHKHSKKIKIYLCMEEPKMWQDLKLTMPVFA
ncbi:MAG: hypothetical protein NC908_05585, partial [Candidatus Omnitrophica bacterium]|nr:hypothetical protein [Candidatus Omnitrophota bacterium]